MALNVELLYLVGAACYDKANMSGYVASSCLIGKPFPNLDLYYRTYMSEFSRDAMDHMQASIDVQIYKLSNDNV